MSKQMSIYLDLLRFLAAVVVFLSHAPKFAGSIGWQLSTFGHEAVMFFFILSGFVIAYVVIDRKESARQYIVNRAARIYSVAIPALILSYGLFFLGRLYSEGAFERFSGSSLEMSLDVLSALLFFNESWVSREIAINQPYWSLGYEVLYYLAFGIFFFVRSILKWILLLALLVAMGPSILLYLPIWLAGVLLFLLIKKYSISKHYARVLFVVSLIASCIMCTETVQQPINNFAKSILGEGFYSLLLNDASLFVSDYILAAFLFLNLYSFANLDLTISPLFSFENLIRKLASYTFSLYLFHVPLLYFFSLLFPFEKQALINLVACWVLVPFLIYVLGSVTENKKHLWKRLFQAVLDKFCGRPQRQASV